MYRRFSETQANWSCSLERERPGDVLLRISGEDCDRRLAGECGKHVIQRVPRTEKHGRRQTSVVSVAVLPLPSCGDWTIPDADIEVFTKRGQGPGGQHRNKTESCVVARHVPTGIEAKVDARHQQTNRQIALQRLRERVREVSVAAERRDYNALRQSQMSGGGEIGGRGAKRRTYNIIDSRVVDHVSGRETRDVKSVLNGKLELVL